MFVNNGSVRIHYEIEGDGPAILMRTGAGGDSRIFRDAGYVAGLPGYRKILMDQRGRGESDHPAGLDAHRYEAHIADICAVLDDAGVKSTAFLGYSAGATMGVAFGVAHPERLRALIGIGSLPYANFSERPKPANVDEEIQRIVDAGGVRAEYEAFMKQDNDRFPDPIHQNVIEGDPLMRALDAVAALEWRGHLATYPELRCPVLMLTGELEDSERQTERSIEHIPNGHVLRLPRVGHLSAFYRSDVTLPYIIDFLNAVMPAAKA